MTPPRLRRVTSVDAPSSTCASLPPNRSSTIESPRIGSTSSSSEPSSSVGIVQRCQVHKVRNDRDHLPESRRAYVAKQMRDAYTSTTAATAKKKLMQLASWLESNGEDSAAASLREGLDETLTVMRLALPATLRRTFATRSKT